MKTFMLSIPVFIFFLTGPAQTINNPGFENWVAVPNTFGAQDPQDWKSTNAATAGANLQAIKKSTDKHSGTYALQLSPLISGAGDTLVSAVVLGQAPLNFSTYKLDHEKGGLPFTTSIESVSGYYKFSKNTSSFDSAYAIVLLKNKLGPGYVASGKLGFAPTTSYQPFTIGIQPLASTAMADSLVIAFFYKSTNSSFMPDGKLLIDSLYFKEFINTTGVHETMSLPFSMFPNPVTDQRMFIKFTSIGEYTIELFSISGCLLEKVIVESDTHTVSLQDHKPGLYLIRVTDALNHKSYLQKLSKE